MYFTKKIFLKFGLKFFDKDISQIFLNFFFLFFFFLIFNSGFAQCGVALNSNCDPNNANSAIIMDTQPNKEFIFDTFGKFQGGITYNGSTILKLKVASSTSSVSPCQWKLVMIVSNGGSLVTPVPSEWETRATYGSGSSSNKPSIDNIQVRVSNGCGTPQNSGVWQSFINNIDGDVINIINPGSLNPVGVGGLCGNETNGEGTYLGVDYNEFSFIIDYRIVPLFDFTPGRYELSIKFCLVEI
jgi:hypothetical protein